MGRLLLLPGGGPHRLVCAFAVLAASCKEEIAPLVFMLGLLCGARPATGATRRLAALTMALSLLWAFTAVFFIQERLAAGNIH